MDYVICERSIWINDVVNLEVRGNAYKSGSSIVFGLGNKNGRDERVVSCQ